MWQHALCSRSIVAPPLSLRRPATHRAPRAVVVAAASANTTKDGGKSGKDGKLGKDGTLGASRDFEMTGRGQFGNALFDFSSQPSKPEPQRQIDAIRHPYKPTP
jgi:hypothetical protein